MVLSTRIRLCINPQRSSSVSLSRTAVFQRTHHTRYQHKDTSHPHSPLSILATTTCTVHPSRQQVQHTLAALALDTIAPTALPQEPTVNPSTSPMGTVPMQFQVHCAAASRVLLVGSPDELGAWDIANAVPLHFTDNNWWTTPHNLHLPVGALIEYKYVIVDPNTHELHWQHGNNESAQLPHDSEGRVWILKDEWDRSDHLMLTGAHENDAVQCVLDEGRVPPMARIPMACFLCGRCAMPQLYAATCPRLHRPPRIPVMMRSASFEKEECCGCTCA